MNNTEKKALQMWRTDEINVLPVLVDCPNGLWPAEDADGVTIFVNTHFKTREEAVEKIELSLLYRLASRGREVIRREQELDKARKNAADAAAAYAKFKDAEFNYELDKT